MTRCISPTLAPSSNVVIVLGIENSIQRRGTRTSADGIRRRIVRLQLDSSSLHFSSPGPSPRSIIYRSLEFLLTHYTRFAFHLCGPYFYIPVRTCLRENRYRFDSVPPPSPPFVRGTEGTIGSPISDTRIYTLYRILCKPESSPIFEIYLFEPRTSR